MSSVLSGSSMQLNNVYVRATGTTCGIDEFNGPLGQYFDRHYPDFHFGHKSYELAEMAMLQDAISHALKKGKLKKDDINVFLGGDLNNQVTASNYTAKDFQRPFMAMYGACATMGLVINTASMLIENHCIHNANCFVCSHNATAERQFRYPINDYIYEFPAGLVEKGEDATVAAVREMYEETGLTLTPVECEEGYNRPFFTTIGMTDESCATVYGYLSGEPTNIHQEASEDIQVILADREECKRILKEENVAIICAYMLMHFIYSEDDPFGFLKL